jgi:hypothetical protein
MKMRHKSIINLFHVTNMTNLHIHVYIYNHDIEKLQVSLMYFCTAKNMEQFTSQLSVSFPNNNKSIFGNRYVIDLYLTLLIKIV